MNTTPTVVIEPNTRWTDEFTCADPRRFGHVLVTEVSETGVTFRQETALLHIARKDFERWFSRVRCRCDDIGDGPCPACTGCAFCVTRGAVLYAEDDTTPLCEECAA